MKRIVLLSVIINLIMTTAAISLNVTVTIPPYKFFVERITGKLVNINLVVKPGINAHTFSPTPLDLMKLSHSDIYFACGSEFERKILDRVKRLNPKIKVIYLDRVVSKIRFDNSKTSLPDPHIWNSPIEVIKQVKLICDRLCEMDDSHSNFYTLN